jgi:hypothetical protein
VTIESYIDDTTYFWHTLNATSTTSPELIGKGRPLALVKKPSYPGSYFKFNPADDVKFRVV